MESIFAELKRVTDLTTQGTGALPDAEALVYQKPRIRDSVPGAFWHGKLGNAQAVMRFPDAERWNGCIMIGATPAVRTEFSLDLLLSDFALQQGYAYAACDKGTPMFVLRDPNRQITEWPENYLNLTRMMKDLVVKYYGASARRTLISGVSNGGYITRIMLERHPDEFDGGVEWEGVYWDTRHRHIMTCLPVYISAFPIYKNFRGDRTENEQHAAFERLVEAGLHPESAPYWDAYFYMYWTVTLWLYGRNLDPDWPAFQANWSDAWIHDPSPLAHYPWQERMDVLAKRIQPIQNTAHLTKPLLSVAGNWDSLISYRFNAEAYANAVQANGCGAFHRMYEIESGNHVDGLLKQGKGTQQPVLPFYESALLHMENWLDRGAEPPASGLYATIDQFAKDMSLKSL